MSLTRIHNLSISLDGFATGEPQSADAPFGHADLRELAGQWGGRVDVVSATIDERPADALLIRPDALIAWAATVDAPGETALPALREALTTWFGAPST